MASIKKMIVNTNIFQRVTAFIYHEKKQQQMKNEYKNIIDKYKTKEAENRENKNISPYIWLCWWQGYDGMTPLVKGCVDRIQKFNQNKKVILITEENVDEYVIFPEYIIEKYKKGIITKTNMSDLLRAALLEKYGGCWMDATLFTNSAIPDKFYDYPVYTGRYTRNKKDYNISKSRWTSYFFIARYPKNILFSFLKDFWYEYWKKNDVLTEYFMIDYAIDLGYRNISGIKQELNLIDINGCGKDVWKLLKSLSNTYDSKWMKNLEKENWMQKLTYKVEDTVQKKSVDPENCIYKKLFLD